MNSIRVIPSFDERNYNSIEDALTVTCRKTARSQRAELESKMLNGSMIEHASWSNDTLTLYLSTRRSLIFCIRNSVVEWDLCELGNEHTDESKSEESILLSFSNSHTRYQWNRTEVINKRLNHRIDKLFAGDACAYLYVAGCPILLLNSLVICDTEDRLLFWDDID
jgi:hypothetical protein